MGIEEEVLLGMRKNWPTLEESQAASLKSVKYMVYNNYNTKKYVFIVIYVFSFDFIGCLTARSLQMSS